MINVASYLINFFLICDKIWRHYRTKKIEEKKQLEMQRVTDQLSKISLTKAAIEHRMKVLIIDDEDFGIIDHLRNNNYSSSFMVYFFDSNIKVKYVEQCEAFDIIYVDYKGVATEGYTHEGLSYACKVKEKYPNKYVCVYSSGIIPANIDCNSKSLDDLRTKHADIDTWIAQIKSDISIYLSSEFQLKSLGLALKINNVTDDTTVKEIENEFIKVLRTKQLDDFIIKLSTSIDDTNIVQDILSQTASILTLVGAKNE